MMKRLFLKIIDRWMSKCEHRGDWVAADVTEGASGEPIKYCRMCGAIKLYHSREWRRARPLWCAE